MGIAEGRTKYDEAHPSKEARKAAKSAAARPKRGEKGVAAGRALAASRDKWDPLATETGDEGTDV